MKFNIGDEIRIIDAGFGATGCNGSIGIITNRDATNGLDDDMKGFNVEIVQGNYRATKGEAWRVDFDGEYELIKRNKIKPLNSNVHIYEQQPYIYNTLVKNPKGELCEMQSITKDKSSYKVIYNGLTTIVIFEDGSKGIARCNPADMYSRQLGHDIAFNRAKIKSLKKELRILCNNDLIQAANKLQKELNQLCGKGV